MGSLAGYRILLIEDEEIIASLLEDSLLEAGASEVGFAVTLDEARGMLAAWRPHGVLLDLNLNGVRATSLMQQLRDSRTPFLVTTGYDSTDVPIEVPEEVMMKPYDLGRLVGAVERMLQPVARPVAAPG